MPDHLRALVVIIVLATAVFMVAKRPVCSGVMSIPDFERRRNLWFGLTFSAFLAHNFWIYIIVAMVLLAIAYRTEKNKMAMFYFVILAVPALQSDVTGLGIIKHFFTINYPRLLTLTILFPAFLHLRALPENKRLGSLWADKFVLGYLVMNFGLMLSVSTLTNTLRHGFFYAFIDIFLPYYVASRALKDLKGFRDALMALVIAAAVLSAIGIFEFARHWLLYASLEAPLGIKWNMGNYLSRGELLRAQGSAGHSIVLGYFVAVAFGFYLFVQKSITSKGFRYLGLMLLLGGLISPLSRGPWVGAAAMLLIFMAIGPEALPKFVKMGLAALVAVPILISTPEGRAILDYLPFIGTVDESTVAYRERLLEISLQVMFQNPFFGAFDYIYSPAMQDLRQGQGIIDMVNTYLAIGLASGFVGLALFAGFFIAVALGIFRAMRRVPDRNDEHYRLGQALLATLLGIMVIIFTVSSINIIPIVYWSVGGLGVAYAQMMATARIPAQTPQPSGHAETTPRRSGGRQHAFGHNDNR